MVKIRFSSALKKLTNTSEITIDINQGTLRSVLDRLVEEFGNDFKDRILDKREVRRFVNIYINGDDIRHLEGLESKITDADEISILPAVSGGVDELKTMSCLRCDSSVFEIQKTKTGNMYIKCKLCNGIISPLQPDMSIKEFIEFWDNGLAYSNKVENCEK